MGHGLWTVDKTLEGLTYPDQKLYAEWVDREAHHYFNNKTTTLVIKLKNGFEIVGTSGCEDPKNFNADLGRLYALKDALGKLNEFTAFYRAQKANEHDQVQTERFTHSTIQLTPEEVVKLKALIK